MGHIERIQAFALDRHSLSVAELEERLETLRAVEIEVPLFEEFTEDAQLSKDEADLKLRLAIDRQKQEDREKEEKAELEAKNAELQAELEEARKANEERDRKQSLYDEEQERVRREAADAVAKEQETENAARQKELDDLQAVFDRQTKQREDADREAAELKASEEKAAEEQAIRDLQAPDVVKLLKYADAIDHLIGLKPVMGSTNGNVVLLAVVKELTDLHDQFTYHIEEMT
jgi:hypothetical protein